MSADIAVLQIRIDSLEARNAARDLERLRGAGEGAERSTNTLTTATRGLSGALAAVGISAGVAGIVQMSDTYTKFAAQLRLASQSQREFSASYADVKRIATAAQQDLGATAMLYARIANGTREIGIAQAQVAKITETVNLALKVSGATAQEAASAQLQLSQAFASGTLRGEEFNAVNEAAPRIMLALADGIGVPVGALKKMAEEGKITSAIMSDVLPKALEKVREEAKQIQTVAGAFTVLKNNAMEFVGVQAQASGAVSVLTGAIGALANNLTIMAGAVATLTAVKLGTWMAAAATSAYASVAANQALLASNLAAANSTVAAAAAASTLAAARLVEMRASVLAATGTTQLALVTNGLIPAQARAALAAEAHAAALAAQGVAMRATSVAAGVLRGAVAFLGGPIGAIITLLGVGATAWMVWGDKAKEASETAASAAQASSAEILAGLEAQNQKLRDRITLSKAGNPEAAKAGGNDAEKLSSTLKEINALKAKGAAITGADQIQLIELEGRYASISKELATNRSLHKDIAEIGAMPKAAEWASKYADSLTKMTAKLTEYRKDMAAAGSPIDPKIEAAIRAEFEAKSQGAKKSSDIVKKALKEEEDAYRAVMQLAQERGALRNKEYDDINAYMQTQQEGYNAAVKGSRDALAAAQDEYDQFGMSKSQIAEVTLLRLKDQLAATNGTGAYVTSIQQQIDLQNELIAVMRGTEGLEANKKANEEMNAEWKKSVEKYNDIFRTGFADMVNGGKDSWKSFTKSLVTTFKTSVADQIYKMFAQPFVVKFVASMMGVTGSAASGVVSAATGSAGSSAMSYMSTLSSLKTAYSAITTGISATIGSGIASAGALFGSSAMSAFGTGMGMSAASVAGATASGAVSAGVGVTGSAATAMSAGSSAGASAGFAIPIVGWIAAGMALADNLYKKGWDATNGSLSTTGKVLGAGILGFNKILKGIGLSDSAANIFSGQAPLGRLFGRQAPKVQNFGIEGTLTGSGLDGNAYQNIKEKGGVFRSDKKYKETQALGSDTSAYFSGTMQSLIASVKDFGSVLGLESDNVNSYSKKLSLELTSDEAKNKEALAGLFSSVGNELSVLLEPGIAAFTQGEEEASATLQRLAVSLSSVNGIFDTLNLSMYATSLAGGDIASKLADLFGGLDNMATVSAGYFQGFYSEQEKVDTATRQLGKTFSDLGFVMPVTKSALRDMIEAEKERGEAGQKSFAQLMMLSGAFDAMTTAADQLAAASAETARIIAEAAAAIAEQRGALEAQIYDMTHTAAEALTRQRKAEIDAMDATLRPLQQTIYGLQDLATAADAANKSYDDAKSATNAALQAVQRAIAADKSRIGVIRDVAAESVRSITTVFDLLKEQVSQLYGTVGSTSTMQAAQGNTFIDNALKNVAATGYLPDQKDLQDAISAARGGLDASQFATQIEADVAALVMAGKLSQLQVASGYQLTAAEQSLQVANQQLDALDAQLTYAQQQVDALNDINIGVLSITDAIASLSSTIIAAMSAQRSSVSEQRAAAPYQTAPTSGSGAAGAVTVSDLYTQALGRTPDAEGLAYWTSAFGSTVSASEASSFFDSAKTVIAEQKAAGTWGDFQEKYYPSFDVGINRVPYDMPALIHADEAIIPAAFNPFNPNARSAMTGNNNAELLAELRAQRAENKEMAARLDAALYAIAKNTMQTADTIDTWDGAGMPMERVEA